MREIKYRAWDEARNEWIPNDLLFMDYDGRILSGDIYNPPCPLINPKNVAFYTGLKDMNGKEIYSGDIVKGWKDSHWHEGIDRVLKEVEWLDDSAGFNIDRDEMRECEIIGNIYESRELLEG